MAELLRTGHSMLNIACPICNNPIFKNREGKKFCPTCNREVIISNSAKTQKYRGSEDSSDKIQVTKEFSENELENSIKKVIVKKIQLIVEKLELITEIDLIKRYSELLSELYDLFKKLTQS